MDKKLTILWTSGNPGTAHLMVFMYAINSVLNHWWDQVEVVAWGAAVKLISEDQSIQDKIELAQKQGVKISSCISCAAQYGVVDKLIELGIEVIPWGEPMTKLLQSGAPILSV